MRKGVVIAIGGLAALLLVAASSGGSSAKTSDEKVAKTSDEKVTGVPRTKRLSSRAVTQSEEQAGWSNGVLRFGPAVLLLDGQPVAHNDIPKVKQVSREIQAYWSLMSHALPTDADKANTDAYSKELYWVPGWLGQKYNPDSLTQDELLKGGNGVPVDEFGRTKAGQYGQVDNSLWGQTLGGLLKNPLFKAVVVTALIASGPEGMAVYGAYTMWENRGKDLTATNVLLSTGRAYAVSQCGPACGVAFDFGVGVASGKSYDKAAEDALMTELTDEQKAYYQQGKTTVHKMGL